MKIAQLTTYSLAGVLSPPVSSITTDHQAKSVLTLFSYMLFISQMYIHHDAIFIYNVMTGQFLYRIENVFIARTVGGSASFLRGIFVVTGSRVVTLDFTIRPLMFTVTLVPPGSKDPLTEKKIDWYVFFMLKC